MVMDRIGGFANLSREFLAKFQGTSGAESIGNDSPVPHRPEGAGKPAVPADSAEISDKAHQLNALRNALDSGREALAGVPEVRQDRVAEARSRLRQGYYNSVEVRQRVAERLDDVARKLEDL